MATKSAPAVKAVPQPSTATKPDRKPKAAPPNMAQKFKVMSMVQDPANATVPDVTLAKMASDEIGRIVQPQSITEYRKQFGLATVRKPKADELSARLAEVEARAASADGAEAYIEVLVAELQRHNVPVPPRA